MFSAAIFYVCWPLYASKSQAERIRARQKSAQWIGDRLQIHLSKSGGRMPEESDWYQISKELNQVKSGSTNAKGLVVVLESMGKDHGKLDPSATVVIITNTNSVAVVPASDLKSIMLPRPTFAVRADFEVSFFSLR